MTEITTRKMIEALTAVKTILQTRWHQGYYAVNKYGKAVMTHSEDAVAFCLTGAIMRVNAFSGQKSGLSAKIYDSLRGNMPRKYACLSRFNDNSTHEEVLNVVQKTIDQLKEEASEKLPES